MNLLNFCYESRKTFFHQDVLQDRRFRTEEMRSAITIRTSETIDGRDRSALGQQPGEITFLDRIRRRFVCIHVIRDHRQTVYVPTHPLILGEMSVQTLVQPGHGASDVTVVPFGERDGSQRPYLDDDIVWDVQEEDVCPLTDHMSFLRSSSSTSALVLILMIVLLSSILDSDILAISVSFLP